ncbi:uncharacterized protein LOC108628595, partial [Ceratina calcarata]|uniref:Uncharacterized protein LOC108628595 n=1 Tax=Ceratina calcarata TaxID=156304 RepID=A0AAJ7WDH5_9HYME
HHPPSPVPPPPPPPPMAPPPSPITTGTKSLVAERLSLAQSPVRVRSQYNDTASLTLQGSQTKIQRIKMSEAEDVRTVAGSNDFQRTVDAGSGRSSSIDYLDTYEDIPKETAKEYPEETKEGLCKEEKEKEAFLENERKSFEEKRETTHAAGSRTGTSDNNDHDERGVERREESARGTGATSSPGIIDGRNENAPVGEWNSLPLLVERLRAALELSLGGRRRENGAGEQLPEDSGVDSEEDFRIRNSMEQALGSCNEPELKKDLKFLEDLLLSDIQTALSRLRETLQKIDVTAVGAASDPTSKLQLLRLVSSLLSRLQVSEQASTCEKVPAVLPSTSLSRRRRGTRHTIGVSTEELAKARKWLEVERNIVPLKDVAVLVKEQKERGENAVEKKSEEIRDKCTKDAINQRQLLEDKNKEVRDSCVFRGIQQVDVKDCEIGGDSSMYQVSYKNNYQSKEYSNENCIEDNEERSRVSQLAAALRQRAELATSGAKYVGNKFSAKKSKIKRANTIDIPSYLKLQAQTLGHETTGCVSLRRPINVGDKAYNSASVIVPAFQPKTENDRKFLALINKNNESPAVAPVVPFKTLGQAPLTRTMDMSSVTNENWNSKFSNLKTNFDKQPTTEENKPSLKTRANKIFGAPQAQVYPTQNYVPQVTSVGFRHASSSPFRKIEKPSPVSPSKVPPSYHWPNKAPMPLKEKARMMFDKENTKSLRSDEKPSFPRPPWIERNENRTNDTVTENGKLDYRSFCKQFAPFVGKAPPMQSKKPDIQQRVPGVVDGKISFKVVADKRIYPPTGRRDSKEKMGMKSGTEHIENIYADAMLRGSSSVAVQTGIDDHQDEGRSFKVTPKMSRKQNPICSNAAVQTASDLDKGTTKQWKPLYYEQSDSDQTENGQRFVLDHNQNYRTVSNDSDFGSPGIATGARHTTNEQDFREQESFDGKNSFRESELLQKKNYLSKDTDNQDYPSSFVSPAFSNYNQSDEVLETPELSVIDWPTENSDFLDDQHIQNQDISPEVGVVTRYTCAIATVASVDSPEPRSEEVVADSRTSSSPSPSPSQWSWSRSRPPTNETVTSEEEIRRHNLLQQSLVRRLQNEITSLNEPNQYQDYNLGQHLTVQNQPKHLINQSSNIGQSQYSQSQNVTPNYHQRSFNQSQSSTPSDQSYSQIPSVPSYGQQNYNKPPPSYRQQSHSHPTNLEQSSSVSQASNRFPKHLAPAPQKKEKSPSPGTMPVNRVTALREAYEQTPSAPPKPIHKERSPIPNGSGPIDSSDEYLVSCTTKPTRSIVLSKSESWHQLAATNSSRTPRAQPSPPIPRSHPKPPKPRSPFSQKLRSKQFEASSMADSVKKMEDKIRQYFDQPSESVETKEMTKHRRSSRFAVKGMVGLSRSRTMPGLADEKLHLLIPEPQQVPLLNVNTADVDKVFDDLFEEATRTDNH